MPLPSAGDVRPMMETTLLSPAVQRKDVERVCREAAHYGFAAVCVCLSWIETAAELLKGTDVRAVAAVDFPFGATPFSFKADAVRWAAERGAREVNVAVSLAPLLAGDKLSVRKELQTIRQAVPDIPLKAVLETSNLSDAEIIMAVRCAEISRFEFVAGGTGFFGPTALPAASVLCSAAPSSMKVAAAGDYKSVKQITPLAAIGVTRILSSSPVSLLGLDPIPDEEKPAES